MEITAYGRAVTPTHSHRHTDRHTRTRTPTHTDTHSHMYTHTHTYTNTHTHSLTHTHTHRVARANLMDWAYLTILLATKTSRPIQAELEYSTLELRLGAV